jgi:hypothetical protein
VKACSSSRSSKRGTVRKRRVPVEEEAPGEPRGSCRHCRPPRESDGDVLRCRDALAWPRFLRVPAPSVDGLSARPCQSRAGRSGFQEVSKHRLGRGG